MFSGIRSAILLAGSISSASASSLHFVSPACGHLVSGTVSLAVAGSSAVLARVDFSMGSHPLASASGGSFSAVWNSAEAMDGVSAIQAQGYDAAGNALDGAECLVQVSNRQASLAVNSPDLSQTLSGSVRLSVTGSDLIAFPAVWTLNIDGEEQSTVWTDNTWTSPLTVQFTLDTTRFTNGAHELHISMNSRSGPSNPQWVNWRGMVNRVVTINNGRQWMDTSTAWQNMYLAPGQRVAAGCKRLFTDGSTGPCGTVTYQSSNPSVAAVDGASGVVFAAANGFAQITVTDGAKTSTAQVWVSTDARVPHFEGNGTMRRGYGAGKSLFVIAPFFLDPPALTQNQGLEAETVRAGINTLGFGLYLNPRNTSTSFDSWKSSFDQTVLPKMQWAANNGFHMLLTGDDIFRQIGSDAWYTVNWPSGKQAVQYAVSRLGQTGAGIGIEGIDEASSIWGARPVPQGIIGSAPYLFDRIDCSGQTCNVHWPGNPLPNHWNFALRAAKGVSISTPGGSVYTASNSGANGFSFQTATPVNGTFTAATSPSLEYEWFAGKYCTGGSVCNPAVPNNALAQMRSWIESAPSAVPMAFPPLAVSPPSVHGAWMGPGSVSDYASNYFSSLKTRTTYPWSEGIQEMTSSMTASFSARQPYLMADRPQLMLVSLAGPSYTKRAAGSAVFQPGTDALDEPGVSAGHVSALMMEAAALGGAGLRLYFFEPPSDWTARANAPAGTYFQTGANPANLQPDNWRAMAYASNLLTRTLEPYLLGAAASSPAFGRNIVTAVREGAGGMMLMIVNGNDWARTVPVDFSPYAHAAGTARYHVKASGIQTDLLPGNRAGDSAVLGAGETMIYLFPNSVASMPLQVMNIPSSAYSGHVQGVRYGYIYPGSSASGPVTSCSSGGCVIARDPQLGDLFYQLVGTGAPGAEVEAPSAR